MIEGVIDKESLESSEHQAEKSSPLIVVEGDLQRSHKEEEDGSGSSSSDDEPPVDRRRRRIEDESDSERDGDGEGEETATDDVSGNEIVCVFV